MDDDKRGLVESITYAVTSGTLKALSLIWITVGGALGLFINIATGISAGLPPTIGIVGGFVLALFLTCRNLEKERQRLQSLLDDRDKLSTVAHRLGEFGLQAKDFIKRGHPVAQWKELRDWAAAVEHYLEFELGRGHRFMFKSGAGNEPNPPDGMSPEEAERWIFVQARLMTLKEFVRDTTRLVERTRG